MKKIKYFATHHPYLFALVIFPVIPCFLMLIQFGAAKLLGFENAGAETFQDCTKILAMLLYLMVLWRFGWLRPAGLLSPGRWQAWLIVAAASIFEVVLVIRFVNGHFDWINLANFADPPAYFLVGLFEEIAFRGLILFTFLYLWGDTSGGMLKSVLISSVIFGAGHLITIMTGNTLLGAVLQAASCTISGILWAALVLYGQSIWPVVIGHFLVDAIGNGNLTSITDITRANWLIFWAEIPLLLFGLYMLRRQTHMPAVTKPRQACET